MEKTPWIARLRQVTEFVNLHGRLPERHGYQTEKPLSNWIGVQRQKYRTGCLTEEQIRLYADIGIINRKPIATTEAKWFNFYQQYLNFIAQYGKKPSANKANAEEYKLHSWAGYQRKSCTCRTKKQQKMLISAGIISEALLEKRIKTAQLTESDTASLQNDASAQCNRLFQLQDFINFLAEKISALEPGIRCALCTEEKQCEHHVTSPCFYGNREWLCKQAQDWQLDFDAAKPR